MSTVNNEQNVDLLVRRAIPSVEREVFPVATLDRWSRSASIHGIRFRIGTGQVARSGRDIVGQSWSSLLSDKLNLNQKHSHTTLWFILQMPTKVPQVSSCGWPRSGCSRLCSSCGWLGGSFSSWPRLIVGNVLIVTFTTVGQVGDIVKVDFSTPRILPALSITSNCNLFTNLQ